LFSRDGLDSVREHGARWIHPVNARRILASFDRMKFRDLRAEFPYPAGRKRINRFEDAKYWININVERAQDLWLDRARPIHILDLGCGAGYFLYVCKFFGHAVLGFDTDDDPLFRATTQLLEVPRIVGRIERQNPLPDVGQKFDLVTGHRICFHRIGAGGEEWAPADWDYFLNDVRHRFLNDRGRLMLDFNPRADGSSFFTPALRAFFLSQGARIFRSKALFAKNPAERPRFKLDK
jgi:SAM-dependent methyltransferase